MYLLARLAAKRLTSETLSGLRDWIEKARQRLGDYPYFLAWRAICEDGPDAVVAVLTDATEYGRYMRAVVSLRPFVSQEERDAFYRPRLC
jgi:hypothetical protein